MTTQRTKKRSKSTQLKTANFVTKLFSKCHKCFLYWRKLKLPKIFNNKQNAEKYVLSRDVTHAHAIMSMY